MKIPLNEFPFQPKQLNCCHECYGKKKECDPDPMKCPDFWIANKGFIDAKLASKNAPPQTEGGDNVYDD